MKQAIVILAVGGIFLAIGLPAKAQTTGSTAPNSAMTGEPQVKPGDGGTSKPGVTGKPGAESGSTTSSGGPPAGSSSDSTSNPTKQQDQSHVPGAAGGKSGPDTHRSGADADGPGHP
jgi:hypothetical protein